MPLLLLRLPRGDGSLVSSVAFAMQALRFGPYLVEQLTATKLSSGWPCRAYLGMQCEL